MKKLFTNVGGNQFKLLTEGVNNTPTKPELVREAVKKIFSNKDKEISYSKIYNVGLGYIKDIAEARKCALQEAKELANSYGYSDDENMAKFVKENDFSKLSGESPESKMAQVSSDEHPHDETNLKNPEEKREVQIGKSILNLTQNIKDKLSKHKLGNDGMDIIAAVDHIKEFAEKLIEIHGVKESFGEHENCQQCRCDNHAGSEKCSKCGHYHWTGMLENKKK